MGYEPRFGELGQAFMSYAESCMAADDHLLERAQRLEGRVLALELVVRALVRGGTVGPDLRSTVLQTLDEEFRNRVGSASLWIGVQSGPTCIARLSAWSGSLLRCFGGSRLDA